MVGDLELDAVLRIERRQVVEEDLLARDVGVLEVDRLDLDQGEVALPLLGRPDLPGDGVAGAQVELADLGGRDVDVVGARQVVVLGRAQEAEPVRQAFEHALREDQSLLLGLRLQDLEDQILLAHARSRSRPPGPCAIFSSCGILMLVQRADVERVAMLDRALGLLAGRVREALPAGGFEGFDVRVAGPFRLSHGPFHSSPGPRSRRRSADGGSRAAVVRFLLLSSPTRARTLPCTASEPLPAARTRSAAESRSHFVATASDSGPPRRRGSPRIARSAGASATRGSTRCTASHRAAAPEKADPRARSSPRARRARPGRSRCPADPRIDRPSRVIEVDPTGLSRCLARPLPTALPRSRFNRLDLPTFDRPTKATDRNGRPSESLPAGGPRRPGRLGSVRFSRNGPNGKFRIPGTRVRRARPQCATVPPSAGLGRRRHRRGRGRDALQGDLDHLVHVGDEVELHFARGSPRAGRPGPCRSRRERMIVRMPARYAARILSLMPPTGRTLPAQRDLARSSPRPSGRGSSSRPRTAKTAMVMPADGPVLRDRALRHVDVDVELLVEVRVGVVHLRAAAHVGDAGAGRLLHHVAERARQRQVALALQQARLDRQDLAARLGPGEPRRDADLRDLALAAVAEPRLAQELLQVFRASPGPGSRPSSGRSCARPCGRRCRSRARGCARPLRACSAR